MTSTCSRHEIDYSTPPATSVHHYVRLNLRCQRVFVTFRTWSDFILLSVSIMSLAHIEEAQGEVLRTDDIADVQLFIRSVTYICSPLIFETRRNGADWLSPSVRITLYAHGNVLCWVERARRHQTRTFQCRKPLFAQQMLTTCGHDAVWRDRRGQESMNRMLTSVGSFLSS